MNLRTFLVILISCQGYFCFGQETIKTTHFGVSVTPQLNTAIFKDKEQVEWNSTIGVSASGNIYFDLGSKTQLITGLEFQYAKYHYKDAFNTFKDSMGVLVPTDSYIDNKYSLSFVGLPIQLKCHLSSSEKPNRFFLIGGLVIRFRFASGGNVFIVEDGQTTYTDDIDDEFWAPDKFWFLGTLGIGYEMKCGNHKISIAPSFEYSPGQLYNDQGSSAIADAHPAFLGITFSYY